MWWLPRISIGTMDTSASRAVCRIPRAAKFASSARPMLAEWFATSWNGRSRGMCARPPSVGRRARRGHGSSTDRAMRSTVADGRPDVVHVSASSHSP